MGFFSERWKYKGLAGAALRLTRFSTCQIVGAEICYLCEKGKSMKRDGFTENKSGRLRQIHGHGKDIYAFIPDSMPREIDIPTSTAKLIEQAAGMVGRLGVAGEFLNPWVHLFLRREAIASNAIEGTITTARELYLFEASLGMQEGDPRDSAEREVLNYTKAMEYGLQLLKERPLGLNTITRMHGVLMQGVRGENKRPGEFRKEQNAISKTRRIEDARFIPPPVPEMHAALGDLEKFIHESDSPIPMYVRLAMIHYQFEAIHPFLDGNGRIGRLLIPLLLCSWDALPHEPPRLYISSYLEAHDEEYRHRLLRVSQNGEWAEWINFFLGAIISEARDTWDKVQKLRRLREDFIARLGGGSLKLYAAVDHLFHSAPAVQVRDIAHATGKTRQQASNYVERLVEVGILTPDARKWGRFYYADDILRVFFGDKSGGPALPASEPSAPLLIEED